MEYQTEFLERVERTRAANSYRFQRPAGLDFVAGQYMMVDLGDELVHPLSLSDCPEEAGFIEFTKRMTGSRYCEKLESMTKDDLIKVKGPMGRFTLEGVSGDIVMLAGGIGITPVRSMLKSISHKMSKKVRITLIYGNSDAGDISFRDELEDLQLDEYRLVHVLADNNGMEEAYI